jgi:gas vesicle protein
MILMTIINKVAVAALGPKLGQLIGTIVGFVTMALVMGLNVGKSISEIFKDMMNATNLIALTNAVGNGIAGYIKGVTAGIETQITDVQKQTNDQLKSIEDQMATNFGTSIGPIDMGQITDVSSNNQVTMEPSSVFLTRTLMTGSDIADLSMSMITNFTDLTLNLDLLPA